MPTIDGLDAQEALSLIAELINFAVASRAIPLCEHALRLADELEERGVPPVVKAVLDYFRANAWDGHYQLRLGDRERIWDWDQPEVKQQIFLLRRALNSPVFSKLDSLYRCQILTNLANQLNRLGRFVEAQQLWGRALDADPNFWMARANRASSLMYYAARLYEQDHRDVLALYAHQDFCEAVKQTKLFPDVDDPRHGMQFAAHAEGIASQFDLDAIRGAWFPDASSLGQDHREQAYRQWCLDNVLFLNPLNDIGPFPIAADDKLGIASLYLTRDERPIVVGMANELKQGYASARWLFWEGLQGEGPHCADRDVLLFNTLDYPAYGLSLEKVKLAFRVAYSTLDKIAYFLNQYLALGIPEKKVSFRSIWRDKDSAPVREVFVKSENWPWRGLFWLGNDLFEPEMRNTMEPDARELAELRNHLEHKYVKVHEMKLPEPRHEDDPFHDTLAYGIMRGDLEQRTLRLMQLVRAALIYLFLGMHREEGTRTMDRTVVRWPFHLDPWDDGWKI